MTGESIIGAEARLALVILCAALATYLTRIGGYVMITRLKRIPPRMEAALNAVPAAVLSTLVAPALVFGGADVAIAMFAAFLIGLRASSFWMLIAGWAVVMLLRQTGLF